jgi:hypothetical protein
MRVKIERDDLPLLIIAGSILLIATVTGAVVAPITRGESASAVTSTYSSAGNGAKAAYLLLQDLGYREDRWLAPPTEFPADAQGTVLILADPSFGPSSDEKLALEDFVRHGGRVVATGWQGASFLQLDASLDASPGETLDEESKDFSPILIGPLSETANKVVFHSQTHCTPRDAHQVVYYGDGEGAVVVSSRLENGTWVWWADAYPLSNDGISKASNLNLLLNSIGKPGDVKVLWDEYYHGERNGLWSYLYKTPLPWALLQAAILALAIVFTYSRRSGPIAAAAAPSRLSPIEFVETVGDLYARKHATTSALETAVHRFRGLLARSMGFSPEAPIDVLKPRIAELGKAGAGLSDLLAKCDLAIKAGITDERETLKLFQELHGYTLRLHLAGQGG